MVDRVHAAPQNLNISLFNDAWRQCERQECATPKMLDFLVQ